MTAGEGTDATYDSIQQALLNRMDTLIESANPGRHTPGSLEHVTASVRNLAEAYAWIISPAQPHGGHARGD